MDNVLVETVYVVLWKYSDGSGCGAVCYCEDLDNANALVDMLKTHGETRTFWHEIVTKMQRATL